MNIPENIDKEAKEIIGDFKKVSDERKNELLEFIQDKQKNRFRTILFIISLIAIIFIICIALIELIWFGKC
jgi:hypothetical protein